MRVSGIHNSAAIESVAELMMLFHESAGYHRDPAVQAILHQAVKSLNAVRRQLQVAEKRYVVAVVGLTNVGKSTLLNALFGSDLAPRRNGPCTAAPIEFVFGHVLRLTAYYRHSANRRSFTCDTFDILHQRLAQFADDNGGSASRAIAKIEVEVPLPLLKHGLVIADTPGFGAAQVGDSAGSHEESVRQYIRDEVSQVFWVVLADQGIGNREQKFHDDAFANLCDDVIVTGSEDWDQADRIRFRSRFETQFTDRIPAFHFVSGLEGLRSREANDAEGLERAGILNLEERIRQLADPEGRRTAILESVIQLASDVAYWLDRKSIASTLRWRPDSWLRWSAKAQASIPYFRQISQHLQREY